MQASIQPFAIGDVSIRQLDGLFSLNDLHRASGGEEKHKPALFLRNDQAQALIEQLGKGTDLHLFLNTVKGRRGGTYACRELVIAYAAWISAAFHLKVIRVFLDATAPKATPYAVLPGQTLSAEQAQTLRSLLQDFAQSMPRDLQAQIMVQGWSKLKTHFRVDYRHIPAAQFTEAVNILSRHIAQWAPADPKKTEPQPPSLAGRRWLVWFDHRGQEQHMAVPNDAFALSLNDLPAFLLDAGTHPRPDQLAAIASACVTRLAQIPTAQPPALAA